MRVIGGSHKGRTLKGPSTQDVRPTSDRLRESLFNILAHGYGDPLSDARVIDLFAGTGALGIEALSRGAHFVLFVDDGTEARSLIRANVEALGLGGVTRIYRRDATQLGPMPPQNPFTLAFLDPPYGKKLVERGLASLQDGGWLADGALTIIEEDARAQIELPEGFEQIEQRTYGDTQIMIVRHILLHASD
ncbi:MAG: 16S rRNA (guanine(966)-N(2))-methyltransferase RsmD [Beijerinckiaceae bacterium]|jgi:16S rRNA (guanine966-N2)-methyltransferase|nr:16S rRNA (guanine(966)-N(2))-methyltransferase RsmD [Beijerinckiaceae bacterium]